MLQLVQLHKAFGGRTILDEVSWLIRPGDRVGLVGPNGAGKSTLLKILAGLIPPDAGEMVKPKSWTIGYLPQEGIEHRGRIVREEARSAFGPVLEAIREAQAIEAKLDGADSTPSENPSGALTNPDPSRPTTNPDTAGVAAGATPDAHADDTHTLVERYTELQDFIRRHDGYGIESAVDRVLQGLGFSVEQMEGPADHLSGGWQMRLALAKLLLARPEVLLLDEPTNHLDIESRYWLLEYLRNYPGAVVLVSHDRWFLDRLVTEIAELFGGHIDEYACNYSRYEVERAERIERLRKLRHEQETEIERTQRFIERFRYKASKAAQVQSKAKQLEKLKAVDLPEVRKKINFRFPQPERSGEDVVVAERLSFAYGDHRVLDRIDFRVRRGRKVALVGVNGAGKSTLLKLIAERLEPDAGTIKIGHNVTVDYFAQDQARELDNSLNVYQTLAADAPYEMVPHLRSILGAFLFIGDDVDKPVRVLSGGERNRLALARMLLKPRNLLLLDEPTNHLDIDAKEVLLNALRDFTGTVIFVSHDRYFLDELSTDTLEIADHRITSYPGNYAHYFESKQARAREEGKAPVRELMAGVIAGGGHGAAKTASRDGGSPNATPTGAPHTSGAPKAAKPALSPEAEKEARRREQEEKKRLERERQKRDRDMKALETQVTTQEALVKDLERTMADPELYADRARFNEVHKQYEQAKHALDKLMAEWERKMG